MLPEEVFKRRHFGTPQSFFLITANYIVLALAVELFALCTQINWIFWIVMGLLALYNAYSIRREREEYDKIRIIAYIISIAGMVLLFFVFRSSAQRC
jgi:4-hydroxybenzoate polyprenyltransferase